MNPIQHNINLVTNYSQEFYRIFQVNLKNYFPNYLTGFDIVKFDDEVIKTPDDISMSQHIKEKYGEDGHHLIKILIAGV